MPSRGGCIRKYPISFGNPALGTYRGNLYTTDQSNNSSAQPQDVPSTIVEHALPVDCVVAMINVPPDQVPDGILNLARSHRSWIDHVRIVIGEERKNQSSIVAEHDGIDNNLTSIATAASREDLSIVSEDEDSDENDDDDELPEWHRTYAVLLELCSQDAADQFVDDLDGQPYTFLDERQTCSIKHVVALQGEGGVSLMSPFFAPATKTTKEGLEILPSTSEPTVGKNNASSPQRMEDTKKQRPSSSPSSAQHASDDYHCAVCLERMDLNQQQQQQQNISAEDTEQQRMCILTTVCNHSFHMDCLLQWQDSPCPVCRYDHSGLNEALSQCHACGTTEHNYVCLICGVISCGSGAATAVAATLPSVATAPGRAQPQQQVTSSETDSSLAPTCGALREGNDSSSQRLSTSHARQHYDETFHAYALDTETQHVWDFAGQGYVHRLLQNKEDGKLVEVHDPNHHSQERNLSPGLSQSQEDQVVHRKLEGFASQYYTLLKSQLEQQRIYYEGRLEEVRREYSTKPRKQSADLVNALRQERNQLKRRFDSIKSRTRKAKEDVNFLVNMNESLSANKEPLQRQIEAAQQERADNQRMFSSCLPPLQEKVTKLMLQLEADFDEKPPATGSE